MRLLQACVLAMIASLTTPVWADNHGGYGDYLGNEFANPENARYEVCFDSTRLVPDPEKGGWMKEQKMVDLCYHFIDYASWLAALRGITEVQTIIIEAWAAYATGSGDAQFQAIMQQLEGGGQ